MPSTKWPGAANLEIAVVWMTKGIWQGSTYMQDQMVHLISASLQTEDIITGRPKRLLANSNMTFQGSIILGDGFLLDESEATKLIAADKLNSQVIFPCLNGEDVTSRPDQSPSRFIINFFGWPLNRATSEGASNRFVASDFPDCLAVVESRVKPERMNYKPINSWNKKISSYWWHYGQYRWALAEAIQNKCLHRVLVFPLVSKYLVASWQPSNIVFTHALGVIASDEDALFAVVQSNLHEEWVRENGSTLETRMRYVLADCFDTFPIPNFVCDLREAGIHTPFFEAKS